MKQFPDSILEESVNGHWKFQIPKSNAISAVFATVLQLSKQHSVADFAVSQSTLEQIFIKFAKHQEEKR
jgi:hypothetical protein